MAYNPILGLLGSYNADTAAANYGKPGWGMSPAEAWQNSLKPTSVLGANTTVTNQSTQQPVQVIPQAPVQQQPVADPYAGLRSDISSNWDNYLNSLNQQEQSLAEQKALQEANINSQIATQTGTLGTQKENAVRLLGDQRTSTKQNQITNLRDLAGSIRSAMMAGNTYLGARGAGDSSATNQYSHALTKLGTQQRTGIMNQTAGILGNIDTQQFNLENSYNDAVKGLEAQKFQKINEVGTWFAQAQQQIRNAQAQGQLQKGQDIASLSRALLDQGLQALQLINQENATKRAQLDQWALSVSKTPDQLQANLNTVNQYKPSLPSYSPLNGQFTVDSQGNLRANPASGYSASRTVERDQFGNIINV